MSRATAATLGIAIGMAALVVGCEAQGPAAEDDGRPPAPTSTSTATPRSSSAGPDATPSVSAQDPKAAWTLPPNGPSTKEEAAYAAVCVRYDFLIDSGSAGLWNDGAVELAETSGNTALMTAVAAVDRDLAKAGKVGDGPARRMDRLCKGARLGG